MIHVKANEALIGDSLMCLPFLKQLHATHPDEAIVLHGRLNWWVLAGVQLPWLELDPDGGHAVEYTLSAGDAFNVSHQQKVHMMQAFFCANGLQPPPLGSACYDIRSDLGPVGAFESSRPYVAIAPFSRTDHNGNKAVPPDTWREFARKCDERGYDVHVLGASSDALEGLPTLSCVTMPDVVGVLQGAHRAFTIDTGTSHLAHMISLQTHVLVAPKCTHEKHVLNHHGKYVWTEPHQLSVDTLLSFL